MPTLQLSLLGGFEARLSGQIAEISTNKARALLALLALVPGKSHSRDALLALLWSDRGEEQARASLRQELTRLRRGLGASAQSVLRTARDTVSVDPDAVEIDVALFERAIAEETPEALEQAVALYRGELLAGVNVRDRAFEEWLLIERERLRALAVGVHVKLLAHQVEGGDHQAAVRTARALIGLDSLNETAHRVLIRAYATQGKRTLALEHYEHLVRRLEEEVSAPPEPETQSLYEAIREARMAAEPVKPGLRMVPDAAAHVALPPRTRPSRPGLVASAAGASLVVLGVVGVLAWSAWADRERAHARRTAELETKLEQAELETVEVKEEAQLIEVKLATEAQTQRLETAAVRSELERELLALEQKLAAQEAKLTRLKLEQGQAAAERQAEIDRLRAIDTARDAQLQQQVSALEAERVKLERARLNLEQARAEAETEKRLELEHARAESTAREAALGREREALERVRERLEREREEVQTERRAVLKHIRADEQEKREALETQIAKLREQRDQLKQRLQALEQPVAGAPASMSRTTANRGSTSPIEPRQRTGADGLERADPVLSRPTPRETGATSGAESEQANGGSKAQGTVSPAASLEPSGAPAPDIAAPAPGRVKLALFPFPLGRDRPVMDDFMDQVRRSIAADDRFELSYSYYLPEHAEATQTLGISPETVWTGNLIRPAADLIYQVGEELGADGVVLINYRAGISAGYAYAQRFQSQAYLFDVALRQRYDDTGSLFEFSSVISRLLAQLFDRRQAANEADGDGTVPTGESSVVLPQTAETPIEGANLY